MDLKNKVAIVTGASSGIGEAIVENLHEAGVKLIFTGQREEKLQSLAGRIPGSEFLAGDLVDAQMPGRLIEMAQQAFGRCHIVINNAGIIERGPIGEIDVDLVCRMVRVNTEAAFRMAYMALQHFQEQGGGDLVNITSVLGTKIRPHIGAYAGTKYALEALSEALRMELAGSDVRVICVQPGLVMTDLHRNLDVHPSAAMGIDKPLQPADVARCVRFALEQPAHVNIPRLMVLPTDQEI